MSPKIEWSRRGVSGDGNESVNQEDRMHSVVSTTRVPVKIWAPIEEVEQSALNQLMNTANLPCVFKHVAAMPDVHFGIGATVGSVVATKGAVIPAAVGVDIGCFHGDTKVPLLDGTQASLRDLSKRTEPFWVYSIGPNVDVGQQRVVLHCDEGRRHDTEDQPEVLRRPAGRPRASA
jgi:hypothetical protein